MFNIYATDYAPVDPITPPCDIVPIFIGYKGENKARCLIFDLTECVETFGDGGFVISFIRQGDDLPYLVTDTDRLDNNAIWIITDTDTAVDGYGMVQLQYIVDDVVCKSALYRTVTFDSNSITGDVPDPYEDLLAQIAAYAAQAEGAATTATAAAQAASTAVENGITTERSQRIAADEGLNTRINELMGLAGAPSMANSAAAMTDSSKIYVYTGSEAGYINGHWYYYNGTEWADGGVYQATAVDTDKTLTVENMAADAAVVGDRIDECMAAFVVNSASGDIASFADGADGVPLKDLVVNISPVQSGTGDPSPSNVRAISGFTAANIYVRGTNRVNSSSLVGTRNGVTITMNNGALTFNGTATGNTYMLIENIGLPVGIYRLLINNDAANNQLSFVPRDASGADIFSLPADTVNKAATITNRSVSAMMVTYRNGASFSNLTIKLYLAPVAQVGEFEPYNANSATYPINFSTAGTVYGGTLDVTSGMLTVTWNAWNMGRFTYGYNADSQYFYTSIGDKAPGNHNVISSIYKTTSATSVTQMTDFEIKGNASSYAIYIKDSRYTDGATLKAALEGQMFACEISNPVSYQLTPTEVKTLLGINNIWADTGSVASCEYRADTKLYLEKLTTPDSDMVADANITSGSYFMVNNNLYLATANIANGGAITPGTNCTATNLAAALNAINS